MTAISINIAITVKSVALYVLEKLLIGARWIAYWDGSEYER